MDHGLVQEAPNWLARLLIETMRDGMGGLLSWLAGYVPELATLTVIVCAFGLMWGKPRVWAERIAFVILLASVWQVTH